ncbi:hypothetical protein V8J82_03315 [Gymnodinialimonas sp. 2305UL16-5]|uniref:hypothetical protein n=1 Tax=Gymnodinialimonas mytili TaxID=3126503 RepID=UPI0030AA7D30
MRGSIAIVLCLCGAFIPDPTGAVPKWEQDGAASLVDRIEALSEADITRIFNEAFAQIGCVLPSDLTDVFEYYLVGRVMAHLGAPVEPHWAQAGYFGARHPRQPLDHINGEAIRAAAISIQGRLYEDILSGRLGLRNGVFQMPDCMPQGTIFTLAPYDRD